MIIVHNIVQYFEHCIFVASQILIKNLKTDPTIYTEMYPCLSEQGAKD